MAVQERADENSLSGYSAEIRAVWDDGQDPSRPFTVAELSEKPFACERPDDRCMAELIKSSRRQAAEY